MQGCHLQLTGEDLEVQRGEPHPLPSSWVHPLLPRRQHLAGRGWGVVYGFAFQQQHLGTWESWVTTGFSAHFSPECKALSTTHGT